MIPKDHKWYYPISLIIWFVAVIFILIVPAQSDFLLLIIGFPNAFIAYVFIICNKPNDKMFTQIIALGLLARVIAIFFFPQLSDDIYRFIWDGRMTHYGLQPYAYIPAAIAQSIPALGNGDLLSQMNSPHYYTVYPPVSQLIFYLSSWLNLSVAASSMIMKSLFLTAELITLWYSIKILNIMKLPAALILIYWLNPLIIIEGIGNLHFEIIMIALLAVAMYCWMSMSIYKAMIFLALSVGTKLLTALLIPFLLWQLTWKNSLKAIFVFSISLVIVFLPLLYGFNFEEFFSSIDLYFRKFEFNASIYYLLRWIGFQMSGYNLISFIGPLLGLSFLFIMLIYTLKKVATNAFVYLYTVFLIYILLATTVHPWYLSVPIYCSIFVRSRVAVVWSSLIWITYINYSYPEYSENLWLVAIEYIVVALYIWKEIRKGDENLATTCSSSS